MAINPFHPTPLHYRARYFKAELSWDDVTRVHTYEDKNKSFNELSDTPPQEWELVYQFDKRVPGHATALMLFDEHYRDRRISRSFTFLEKTGNVVPGCYYKSYRPSHEGHKSWLQTRSITIICYAYTPQTSPTAPVLSVFQNSATDVRMVWTPSIDNLGITTYQVRQNGSFTANVGNILEYYFGSLTEGVQYTFEVRALDADGNYSEWSNLVTITIDSSGIIYLVSANGDSLISANGGALISG